MFDFDLPQLQPMTWADAPHAASELAAGIFSADPGEAGPSRPIGEAVADALGFPSVVRAENAALLAGHRPVSEAATTAAQVRRAGKRFMAKVGEADRPNQNARVYPKREWAAAVERANADQCPRGALGGAVDHVGKLDGGNVRNRCIIWRSLSLEADGSILGTFDIVAGHSDGANLLAWLEAGGTLGFSTFGRARGREPTAVERRQYGLGEDDDVVVMEGFELIGIDVVDNPSVRTAWLTTRAA